jgi:hypothetical protein
MTVFHRLRRRTRCHVAWLAALCFWLLLAQAAASWHVHSHDAGAKLAHEANCELCLVAAAVGGAALPIDVPTGVPVGPSAEAPAHAAVAPLVDLAAERAYQSRAPPLART